MLPHYQARGPITSYQAIVVIASYQVRAVIARSVDRPLTGWWPPVSTSSLVMVEPFVLEVHSVTMAVSPAALSVMP